ncbi:MAG: glycosyltransferase [Phycisphaerales bacterium]|nr:glycosyltransferase [Phycisphaerales bacterium]
MRIAMFSWESMHSIAVGGLAPHITELSAAMARLGHEVHIFTRVGPNQRGYDFIDGVHYHRCPFQHHDDFLTYTDRMCESFVWHLGEAEHFLGGRFDIIHGHDWLSCRALRQIKNEWRRPVVFTVHSTEYGRCGNSLWDDPMSRHIRDLEWEGTFLADRVICVSKTLTSEVQEQYRVPPAKLFSIYNGVDVYKYDTHVDVPAVRRKHSVGADDPCVLFAGRITWQKGPDLLLEAVPHVLAEHPKTKIVFAGEGDMRPRLQDRASRLGLADSIRFLGHRSSGELVGLFKSSDLVCVPSRNEPFGIVILEAWSAAKPVVATRIGGPAEFVKDHHTGVTVEAEVIPISDAIRAALNDKEQMRAMGRNGRIEAESKFTWDHAAAGTEIVYSTLMEAKRNGRGEPNGRAPVEKTVMNAEKTLKSSAEPAAPLSGGPKGAAMKDATHSAGSPGPSEADIRRRAHAIYLARKGAPGDPTVDWLQAERELRAAEKPPTKTRKSR